MGGGEVQTSLHVLSHRLNINNIKSSDDLVRTPARPRTPEAAVTQPGGRDAPAWPSCSSLLAQHVIEVLRKNKLPSYVKLGEIIAFVGAQLHVSRQCKHTFHQQRRGALRSNAPSSFHFDPRFRLASWCPERNGGCYGGSARGYVSMGYLKISFSSCFRVVFFLLFETNR